MKIVQLTDIHLTTPGSTIAGRDSNTNFERAVSHMLECHADADALVITGDLSDWGDRSDYERLKQRIGTMPMPVHLCIGNHDDRPTFAAVFPELTDENGFVQYTFSLSRGTGIALDTWGPESHAGFFCKARQAWLHRQLATAEGPIWMFMHHNPIPTHVTPLDSIMLQDVDGFGEVVSAHREKISHIFHGHCHLAMSGSFRGIPISSTRGTNHAGWPNYKEHKLLTASELFESYAVIFVDNGSTTVQMVEFGYSGPIRVEASPDYEAWDRETMVR